MISHSHGGRDRTSVLGPCLDRHFSIAMAIAQGLEGREREREREKEIVDSSYDARYGRQPIGPYRYQSASSRLVSKTGF